MDVESEWIQDSSLFVSRAIFWKRERSVVIHDLDTAVGMEVVCECVL